MVSFAIHQSMEQTPEQSASGAASGSREQQQEASSDGILPAEHWQTVSIFRILKQNVLSR
jgi:hypothetical protein